MSEYGTLTLEVDGVAVGPTTSWSLHGTFKNPEQWPFGTIVRPTNIASRTRVLVLADKGWAFDGIVVGPEDPDLGMLATGYRKNRWEPE